MSLISGNENKIFARGEIGNVRKAQEDSHGYKLGTPNGDLFVVCDGMGGHVGGATASRIAVDSIVEHIDKERYATPIEALNGALQFANMQILGYADAHPELKGMGTTACIVLVQGNDVWIAHVGDSRIYLYLRKEKQLHRITKDHSYVQTLVDAGQITDEEAEHHPNKNRIMKALGIKPELQPTFNFENKPIHPKNGDVFLICSDGLSGMIPDSTIERVLSEDCLTLQQKGDTLIDRAMDGETVCPGGQDNCTVELIEIDNSNWSNSEFKSYNPTPAAPTVKQEPILQPFSTASEVTPPSRKQTTLPKRFKAIIMVAVMLVVGGAIWFLCSKNASDETAINKAVEDTMKSYNVIKELENEVRLYKDSINLLEERIRNLDENEKVVERMRKAINELKDKIESIEADDGLLNDAYNTHDRKVGKLNELQDKSKNTGKSIEEQKTI